MNQKEYDCIIIAGPTASGKSDLALKIAQENKQKGKDFLIINADSRQMYRNLKILSAQPINPDDSHKLYAFLDAFEEMNMHK